MSVNTTFKISYSSKTPLSSRPQQVTTANPPVAAAAFTTAVALTTSLQLPNKSPMEQKFEIKNVRRHYDALQFSSSQPELFIPSTIAAASSNVAKNSGNG
jgi:hypothetical protein